MLISPVIIRILLVVSLLSMAGLSLFYLSRRRLSFLGYACWGAVALLIPFLGPFLVILSHPGEKQPDPRTRKEKVLKSL